MQLMDWIILCLAVYAIGFLGALPYNYFQYSDTNGPLRSLGKATQDAAIWPLITLMLIVVVVFEFSGFILDKVGR